MRRDVVTPIQSSCQKKGLIESARSKTVFMQGNRQNQVGLGWIIRGVQMLSHIIGQGERQFGAAVVFQGMHRLAKPVFVHAGGYCPVANRTFFSGMRRRCAPTPDPF